MHSIHHSDTQTITSDTELYDVAQLTSTDGLNYSVIVDGTEYRSATPMRIVETSHSGIYTDAYLFDVASQLIDDGHDTITVADHLVNVCGVSRDAATRITSLAFDPSNR